MEHPSLWEKLELCDIRWRGQLTHRCRPNRGPYRRDLRRLPQGWRQDAISGWALDLGVRLSEGQRLQYSQVNPVAVRLAGGGDLKVAAAGKLLKGLGAQFH